MFKEIIDRIFGSIEKDVNTVIDLEKSIQDNKNKALELSEEFIPIIKKLERSSRAMNVYCKLKKSETEKNDSLITLRRIDEKLELAKSEYYKEIGELRKLNQKAEEKLDKLMSNEKVANLVQEVKEKEKIQKSIVTISNAYLDEKLSEDVFEKALKGQDKVAFVMKEFKEGRLKNSHGKTVTDRKQAIAIAMSEAGLSKSEDEEDDDVEKGLENEFLLDPDYIEKSGTKDISKLKKKIVTVTRGGKTFQQTVYVSIDDDKKEVETPIGEEFSPTIKGLNLIQYSDKAIAITGDTYANVELMRDIKKETGVGSWNKKLKAWLFPAKYKETVLGIIYSDVKNSGDDEKAEAIKNQKNALDNGTEINIGDIKGTIEENTSDSSGIKYNIKTKDGTQLNSVDEKVITTNPETDDKKIAEITNNASPESRVKIEKQLYGIKPIEDIYNYSLKEYLGMHGLTDDDIEKVLAAFKNKETRKEAQKRASSGGVKKEYTDKNQIDNLTKRQLIGKLVYAHYQAVKKAIESGETLKPEVLELYDELKETYSKKRKELTEEHKRKIAEALRKNKVPEEENKQIKKENEEAEKVGGVKDIDKENYQPKDGRDIDIIAPSNQAPALATLKTKDYTDIPSLDISIPKPKKILDEAKPYWVPEINMEKFKRSKYTLSAVKLNNDEYLVALDGFMGGGYTPYGFSVAAVNKLGRYAIMSLDAYTATLQYYRIRAKEEYKQEQVKQIEEKIKLAEKGLAELDKIEDKDKRENTRRYLESNLEYYKKQKPTKRLKMLDDNRMTYDQMHMISAFNRGEGNTPIDNRKIWAIYNEMAGDRKQKAIDIDLNQEYTDSVYTKGAETSYGDSGTKDDLLKDYGVKVKRQNGDEINQNEINQIKEALDVVSKLFGKNKEMNKEFGLKISHSGDVNMHARSAVGIFHPFYNAIGVSAKYGKKDFQFTFGHEYAHFMDYWIGKKTGNHYASEKQGSTAQEIAKTLRDNLNKKSSSNYINRTCECFARAFEQYVAIETYGPDVSGVSGRMVDEDNQVNLDVYTNKLKPLIEKFLDENKELLKSLGIDILNKEENDIEKARTGKYADNALNRKLKRVGQPYGKKSEEDTPNGLKTAKNDEPKSEPKGSVEEQAKTASGTALEIAAKEAKDPEVRAAAHKELDRREKEEKVQEEDNTQSGIKKDDKDKTIPEKVQKEDEESGEKPTKEDEKEGNDGKSQQKDDGSLKNIKDLKQKLKNKFKEIGEELMSIDDYSGDNIKSLMKKQREISLFLQSISTVKEDNIKSDSKELKKIINFNGELKDLFGDGDILGTFINNKNGILTFSALLEDGYIERGFEPKTNTIDMKMFLLNPLSEKGQGKGVSIFKNQVDQFKKLGFKKLTTDASQNAGMNGYYTWARLGYSLSENEEKDILKNMLNFEDDEEIKNMESLEELMQSDKGRKWWKEYGFSFKGVFDLSENSKNINILKNYIYEKHGTNN